MLIGILLTSGRVRKKLKAELQGTSLKFNFWLTIWLVEQWPCHFGLSINVVCGCWVRQERQWC